LEIYNLGSLDWAGTLAQMGHYEHHIYPKNNENSTGPTFLESMVSTEIFRAWAIGDA